MKNKLNPKSLVCVFLGYNEKYKGYRCFYPPTGKVFISRHVLFDENHFPFGDLYSQFHKTTDSSLLNSWRSVNLQQSPSETETEALAEDLPTHVVKQVIIPQAQLPQSPVQEQNVQEQNVPDESATESSSGSSSSQSDDDNDVVQQVVPPIHTMTTRARAGIIKPNPRYAMVTVKASHSEPRSLKAALQDPGWYGAMEEEVDNMVETETFELVPPEENQHPVGCGWVHEVKLNADGSVLKLRSRLVARGNEQEEGVDFLETFSPVVRTATIRTVLHVAVTKKWMIKQLDVKNAFLHGDLKESVYMIQPPRF